LSYSEPDALIVGAGASGAAVTWRLATDGWKVTCLDQGGWFWHDAQLQPEWELRRLADLNPDPNIRRNSADYPLNNAASAITPLMYNGVGAARSSGAATFPASTHRTSASAHSTVWPTTGL